MNDTIIQYMTSVFSFVVLIPIIFILYLTITKKLRLRPVFIGIITYMMIYIVTQFVFMGVSSVFGGFLENNFAASITLVSIVTPILTQLFVSFAYARLLPEHRTWRDGVGFGLGIGTAIAIATIGVMIFFAMTLRMSIADGTFDTRLAELTPEQAQSFLNTKENLLKTTAMDYVLLGVAGVSAIITYMALSVLVLIGIEKNNRNYIYYAISAHAVMYAPFFLATGGIVNLYTGGILLVVSILSVIFLFKTHEKMDDNTGKEPPSRPSPLLGRR